MRLAARGTREDESGTSETIGDEALAAALRRQAKRVHVQSIAVAVLLTILLFFTPL